MNADVFQRYEIKYLIDPEQKAFLIHVMEGRMVPDPHGESTICNVYYDTPDYRLIRRSLEKPAYKEKLRIRSYGQAQENQIIFLELKKKYAGVVYKRRIEIQEREAESYLAGQTALPLDSQIGREIEYFRRYYGALQPAVHLCYDRTAFFSKEDPNLRITLDRSIRWSQQGLSLTDAPEGRQLLAPHQTLLEIKTASSIPLWLAHALSEAGIRQVSFSKYGTAYETGICPRRQPVPQYYPVESRGYCYV